MRSSSARISMPIAPWPTHGSITSKSSTVASKPSGTASPVMRAVGIDLEIQPRHAGEREDGRVQFAALGDLLHPRGDVAANLHDVQIRPRGQQRHFPPRAAGGDGRALRKIFQLQMRLESAQITLARRPVGLLLDGFFLLRQKSRVAVNQNIAHVLAFRRGGENQAGAADPSANLSGCGRRGRPGL